MQLHSHYTGGFGDECSQFLAQSSHLVLGLQLRDLVYINILCH